MFRYQLLDHPDGPYHQAYVVTTPSSLSARAIDPSLPTILFVAPKVSAGLYYDPQFQDAGLRSRFNLVLLNHRGAGASNWPGENQVKEGYRLGDAASELVQGAKQLGITQAHLVGADLGALMALRIAAEYPSATLSVSLLGPSSEVEESEEMKQGMLDVLGMAHYFNSVMTKEVVAEALIASGEKKIGNVDTPYRFAAPLADLRFTVEHPFGADRIAIFERSVIRLYTDREPLGDALLARLDCPVLLVQAGEDADYPAEISTTPLRRRLEAAGKDVRMETLDGAPHYMTVTRPAECDALLSSFIASVHPDEPSLKLPLLSLPQPHLTHALPPPESPFWPILEPFVSSPTDGPPRAFLESGIVLATGRALPSERELRTRGRGGATDDGAEEATVRVTVVREERVHEEGFGGI